MNISDTLSDPVSWGEGIDAVGMANAEVDSYPVVSLGDGGSITLTFDDPITDGPGADFAVFENTFNNTFLELAFVEVSSDGTHFQRFPCVSLTQAGVQVGTFGAVDPTNIHNFAGKYGRGFGTPFDLGELLALGNSDFDPLNVSHVRIVDVVGSINLAYRRFDSLGNVINDPWTTDFETGGFDLDAVGVMHVVPEPTTGLLLCSVLGMVTVCATRSRRRK